MHSPGSVAVASKFKAREPMQPTYKQLPSESVAVERKLAAAELMQPMITGEHEPSS